MKAIRAVESLIVAVVVMGATTSLALSDPVLINTSQSQNRRWTAVCTNEVTLRWEWHADATSAQLGIVGMNSTFITNFTAATSSYLWRVFLADTPSTEDVYDLTLTFFDSGSVVVGALTSQLAVVQGALGQTGVISTSEDTPWPKLNKNAVIPYDAGWLKTTADATESQLVIAKQEGVTQTNTLADTAGYFGWKVNGSDWGYGTFDLALTFPGTEGEWNGTLVRTPGGMLIQLR